MDTSKNASDWPEFEPNPEACRPKSMNRRDLTHQTRVIREVLALAPWLNATHGVSPGHSCAAAKSKKPDPRQPGTTAHSHASFPVAR